MFFSGEETMAWIFSGKEGLQAAKGTRMVDFYATQLPGTVIPPDDDQGLF